MIHDQDRSGWIGASDSAVVMGNWCTKTFARWWMEKLGLRKNTFTTVAMQAGTAYEHRILDHLGVWQRDRQIRIRRLRLRVNLDGEAERIKEIKTYGGEFRVSKAYWQQAQVEMFAAKKPLDIVAYKLEPEDYANFFNPIDPGRLSIYPIDYDREWIEQEYLPRLRYLAWCLRRKRWPREDEYENRRGYI